MPIIGRVTMRCPACGAEQEAVLVQSINTRTDPAAKQRLLAGELNVHTCVTCGKRIPLAATLVFHDPDADYYAQVVPDAGGVAKAIAAFAAAGTSGTQRVVRTQNELVEKLKILDAGLHDWAIELVKATLDDGAVLFDRADAHELHWIVLGRVVRGLATPRAQYDELATREPPSELVIDRAWALRSLPN
jgi:hypothetical protein